MLLIGIYSTARFGGHWAEADSGTFALYIRDMLSAGRLIPDGRAAYPNGYAFQAISVMIISMTGMHVAALQQVAYPLLAALLVLPAWLAFRELTGSERGAALATMLLLTQPEFLFVVLRSSHEKFTRVLMLLCLFWLVRSFKLRDRPWPFAVHVGLFYLCTFAFIASNNLLAHSFIVAIASALIAGWLIEWRSSAKAQQSDRLTQRLRYVVIICLGLVYVFTFYAYLPAQHDLLVLQNIWQRLAALLLDVQSQATNSYAQVEAGWVSLPIYFLISIANWVILAASVIIWLRQGWRWLVQRSALPTQEARLLWLFYGAFAIQGGLSIAVDASGVLGSNLQHRLFPSFSIVAVAMVGSALASWRPRQFARAISAGVTGAVACVSLLSVFKATNEPLLSNKWTFYQPGEVTALAWSDRHLHDSIIWTAFDERLAVAFATTQDVPSNRNHFLGTTQPANARDMLMSDVTRFYSSRMGYTVPVAPDALQIYDNGQAQFYHQRPLTPYQK